MSKQMPDPVSFYQLARDTVDELRAIRALLAEILSVLTKETK